MALYAYKGVGPAGRNVNGVREADSPKALRQLMRKDGVVVTECIISKGGKATSAKGGLSREVRLGEALSRISTTDVTAFTRQMATLLRSGIPLAETLAALADQIEKVRFKVVVNQVKNAVNEGASLGDALAKHPRAFNELFVSMVRAGELAGNLDDVLGRLADFMESSQKLKSRVTGALIYPAIMVLVCAGIMTILMVYVVPEITKMFVQQGKELPWNTSLLIFVSDFMGRYILFLAIGITLAIAGFIAWTRSPNGRPIWHRAILHMPLIGPLLRMVAVARFARTLGTMLQSGVPMLRALEISREVVGNVIIKKAIDDARVAVQEGESLAITLKKSGHFPASMIHMVAVGERAGELEQMLMRIADAYDAEVEGKVTRLTTALEPLMLVGMGAAVGFIVVSILTPMMDLAKLGKPGGR
jgi:general secretion pathway protein F